MAVHVRAKLIDKELLKEDIVKLKISSKEVAENAKPGQFIEIKVADNTEQFLRRPISIYDVDKEKGEIEFIFQIKGKGTQILATKKVGDEIDLLGPLGYGTFEIEDYKKVSIIGGGIGTFPLYYLTKALKGKADTTVYIGFRNKELVTLEKEFEEISNKLVLTTDDEKKKKKGYAIEFLKEDAKKEKPDMIFACGPLPMLRAVREFAIENNIPCQISLEERMGCGIGACLGCAVKVISGETERYGHVCKEGPVFLANEVEI